MVLLEPRLFLTSLLELSLLLALAPELFLVVLTALHLLSWLLLHLLLRLRRIHVTTALITSMCS